MKIVKDSWFQGEAFVIDDKHLIDCRLINCTIEYGGGPVILERTTLQGCRYVFSGRAKMTLEFLDCIGLLPGQSETREGEEALVH